MHFYYSVKQQQSLATQGPATTQMTPYDNSANGAMILYSRAKNTFMEATENSWSDQPEGWFPDFYKIGDEKNDWEIIVTEYGYLNIEIKDLNVILKAVGQPELNTESWNDIDLAAIRSIATQNRIKLISEMTQLGMAPIPGKDYQPPTVATAAEPSSLSMLARMMAAFGRLARSH
jgi:hypothetical protein